MCVLILVLLGLVLLLLWSQWRASKGMTAPGRGNPPGGREADRTQEEVTPAGVMPSTVPTIRPTSSRSRASTPRPPSTPRPSGPPTPRTSGPPTGTEATSLPGAAPAGEVPATLFPGAAPVAGRQSELRRRFPEPSTNHLAEPGTYWRPEPEVVPNRFAEQRWQEPPASTSTAGSLAREGPSPAEALAEPETTGHPEERGEDGSDDSHDSVAEYLNTVYAVEEEDLREGPWPSAPLPAEGLAGPWGAVSAPGVHESTSTAEATSTARSLAGPWGAVPAPGVQEGTSTAEATSTADGGRRTRSAQPARQHSRPALHKTRSQSQNRVRFNISEAPSALQDVSRQGTTPGRVPSKSPAPPASTRPKPTGGSPTPTSRASSAEARSRSRSQPPAASRPQPVQGFPLAAAALAPACAPAPAVQGLARAAAAPVHVVGFSSEHLRVQGVARADDAPAPAVQGHA